MPKTRKRYQPETRPAKEVTDSKDSNIRNTVIMFVDIVGASEISNYMAPRAYSDFVKSFQELFKKVCKKSQKKWYGDDEEDVKYETRGDEGVLMIFVDHSGDEEHANSRQELAGDVDLAIQIGFDLKRRWFFSGINRRRVKNGQLPIDLGIGVHIGKTFVRDDGQEGKTPEGYAINYAKRVESFSRKGRYTNIFVSEEAHGWLNFLADEKTYLFDTPRSIEAKGFSQQRSGFEIRHHFLPTDWDEDLGSKRARATMLEKSKDSELDLMKTAHQQNPVNVWLAEETIRSYLLNDQYGGGKWKPNLDEALKIAKYIGGEQRDAGILMIQGLIYGESGDFKEEQRVYKEALSLKTHMGILNWYLGFSYSYQVWTEIGKDPEKEFSELSKKHQCLVYKAKVALKLAVSTSSPWAAWVIYTYGCELIKWAKNKEESDQGVDKIYDSWILHKEVKEEVSGDPYLKSVQDHPKIQEILQS